MALKLYSDLAEWWPLLSPPSDYQEEAGVFAKLLGPGGALLELGSGGGHCASHLKQWFRMTLADLSPGMLAQSRKLNPECEHIQGDMRTLRLGRVFDRVLIHDAICHMATLDDLRQALETAYAHCRPGGAALFAPDWVRETFTPGTDHGGVDGDGRGMRYLEWTWAPDPSGSQYVADLVYALRDSSGSVRVAQDRFTLGLFSREEWLQTIRGAGFEACVEAVRFSSMDRPLDVFLGRR